MASIETRYRRAIGGMIADVSSQLSFFPEAGRSDFPWSVSRDKRLRSCRRLYYYQHYASKGGASPDASRARQELYILKWLRNRFMWTGEIVHELIEDALESFGTRRELTLDELCRRGVARMRAQYAESHRRVYRQRPRLAVGLFEHEYAEELNSADWRAQRERMERCLTNFINLSLVQEIRKIPSYRWLALEQASTFVIDNSRVLVKPDFAWRDESGRVHLVDWKTGQPRQGEEKLQLAVYAIFAAREWGAGPDDIRGHVAYLNTAEVVDFDLSPTDLRWAEGKIRESLREMHRLHSVAGAGAGAEAHFPMTEHLERCAVCNFKRCCGR